MIVSIIIAIDISKDRVLVPLAYIKFDEYIEELQNERETLNKDVNKALKDIEKRPDNKKAFNKKKILKTIRCQSTKIRRG